MLILTRKPGESLYIGAHIKVTFVELKGNQVRLGIEAPSDMRIFREEIYLQILEENKKAAASVNEMEGLAQLSGLTPKLPTEDGSNKKKGRELGTLRALGGTTIVKGESPEVIVRKRRGKPDHE